ncbi:MAG: 2-C-methyl-D-erythritol 4-phosphate cytidylyltransferase [Candidatus Omnitrophica bacterium]|nr:2-C-methyl-D-erythritol 4-phosphate cytidylyltransferase [Candidatus Omnitrophota bacterium]
MKAQAIIPAAGSGTRMGSSIPKTLLPINGTPMIVHTLRAFENCASVDGVVLVVHPDHAPEYRRVVEEAGITKVKEYITGGSRRSESVGNGLTYVDANCGIIVVHDGARPLIKPELIDKAVSMCVTDRAVVIGVPVKQTIKKINTNEQVVERTLDREALWEIQTPQVFHKEILVEAYEQAKSLDVTDDASLVEQMGIKVKVMQGDYFNIKITTPEDIAIAEKLLAAEKVA